ncbi:MAG: calcium-translocating P-type ATPase, PMCA-type [Lachnospiraceae bacterium]
MKQNYYFLSSDAALTALNSSFLGLSKHEANRRLSEYGRNELNSAPPVSLLRRFFAQLKDFMIIILLLAAAISFSVSLLEGSADFVDPIIILVIVVLNAILGVVQEAKAEHSLEALKKLSAPHALVLRDGKKQQTDAALLVPGDIIFLEAGSFVPADARLLSATSLKSDESSLTGESVPVEKRAELRFPDGTPLGDRRNMVFSSGIITAGHGIAVVTATGMNTEVGRIATMILSDETPETPLQKRLKVTGKVLGCAALIICLVIFILGILQGIPAFTMFMTSVSLAVASIPESLPAVVTIMLSLGVQRMAKKQAIIRKLPAVETLGSATYICSDKTGTLTKNSMTVTRAVSFATPSGTKALSSLTLPSIALLCCNVDISRRKNGMVVVGEATEKALAKYALENGTKQEQLAAFPRVFELPFDSGRKCMTTVHRIPDSGDYLCITKGAFDILLSKCDISPYQNHSCRAVHDSMTKAALRVLAVAYRILPAGTDFKRIPLEQHLTMLGLFGMIDPPRPEAREAVRICKQAGITPVMITGDHAGTACAIGRTLGILSDGEPALTGAELDAMSESELSERITRYKVFARVSPEHKVRIVKALRKKGEVVAMTGDGVNDAPALKAADIGCAMGKSGTDVAKNASDMILMDDNFATIVSAVQEGRGIYENIRKSIHFLLSCNIGEIITIFLAILFRMPSPLAAVQLLWVNLITDSLPAIALGVEPPEKDVMEHPPISPHDGMFAGGLLAQIIVEGIMIGTLTLTAYILGTHYVGNASTMAFAVLSFSQLFHAFNMRSRHSLFTVGWFSNRKMVLSFLICTALQLLVITQPFLQTVFKVKVLTPVQWAIVLSCSVAPIFLVELQKLIAKTSK